jgi:hypothetical protein
MKEVNTIYSPLLSVQQVRLIDVFVIAPFCLYVASYKTLPTAVRAGLVVLGVSTAIYNWNNYVLNRK